MATLTPVFVKLPPEKIGELKFLLESYDDLGILRTLNRKTGVVVILGVDDTLTELRALIADIADWLNIREIPPPVGATEDWLVATVAEES